MKIVARNRMRKRERKEGGKGILRDEKKRKNITSKRG